MDAIHQAVLPLLSFQPILLHALKVRFPQPSALSVFWPITPRKAAWQQDYRRRKVQGGQSVLREVKGQQWCLGGNGTLRFHPGLLSRVTLEPTETQPLDGGGEGTTKLVDALKVINDTMAL